MENLNFKNKIMFLPLTTRFEDQNGAITKKSIEFYRRIAKKLKK
jgi:2,4-dienoyl-CoA reductase-like NADH-dependent reductase (Old Yellow Enzyme family)